MIHDYRMKKYIIDLKLKQGTSHFFACLKYDNNYVFNRFFYDHTYNEENK